MTVQASDDLIEARLAFRNLLEEHGLTELAGSEGDALDWLEGEAVKLVNSMNRRRRFIELLEEARRILTGEQGARHPDEDSPGGERTERVNPHTGERFRRINIL